MNTFSEYKASEHEHLLQTYARFDVCLVEGNGATATDIEGKKYIDFGAGIGVNSLGYSESGFVSAVIGQLSKIQHTSNLYYTKPMIELADVLCGATGFDKAFFANSGAEANECAVKLARKYSGDKYGAQRHKIITLVNSFHGRTISTLSATGQEEMHAHFTPLTTGFVHVESGDLDAFKLKLIDRDICAVMLEPVQGEGGVIPLDFAYLSAIGKLCKERDILFVLDEVQTGMGRTGKLLAGEYSKIKPDIVTLAKGLGGGLPIGACLCTESVAEHMPAGSHGSTFGGNPVVCASAKYVVDVINNPAFLQAVRQKGEIINRKLSHADGVKEVRGLGLMIGIVLEDGMPTARTIVEKCLENGLIILTAKSLLRLLPPLNINDDELSKGLEILKTVLKEAKQ